MPSLLSLLALPCALALRTAQEPRPLVNMQAGCLIPREDLRTSRSFTPLWWQNASLALRHIGTEGEGCGLFAGPGRQCDIEAAEHYFVRKWIPKDSVVVEFGARYGTTTCEIAKQLGNSGALAAVEPDPRAWASLDANLYMNNCRAHVVRGAVSKKPLRIDGVVDGVGTGYATQTSCAGGIEVANYPFPEVERALKRKVDTLLIDCEGCVTGMMDQILPALQSTVKTVILEKDGGADYSHFLAALQKLKFKEVERVNDCDKKTTGASEGAWCGSDIWHIVWKRA